MLVLEQENLTQENRTASKEGSRTAGDRHHENMPI